MLKTLSIVAAALGAIAAAPATAQVAVDLGVGIGADVELRVGEPYSYRGYHSGRWYAEDDPRRRGRWDSRYGGYDCYRAFYYTWERNHRVRYESTWCFDERGRDYEVRRTRVVVRLD